MAQQNSYKRILVTSALPYANGPIHLGHLAGAYLPADIYVRYQRMKKRDVVYICGSDEHGVPITIAAEKRGVSPTEIVDEFHKRNKAAFEKFGMSFDYYGRTSSPVHHKTSQDIFLRLYEKGVFKKKTEKQLFDPKTDMFLPDRYVKGTCPVCGYEEAYGDQCEKCGSSLSPIELKNPVSSLSGEKPELKETEHWYLPLGELQDKIEKWINSRKNWKSNVLGQVKTWLKEGLSDRAVTRDLKWGVEVPLEEAKGKVLYVWFDAPIGYISATKEWAEQQGDPGLWKKYWQDKDCKLVHFIGKDNIVFHCIMFPATLMMHGDYILPDNVPANEFLNLEGNKLSTSKNYAVWLEDYCEKYPVDPLRYHLAATAPETRDSDFTWEDFMQRTNSELADILGNFINRTLAFANRRFDGTAPQRGPLDKLDEQMLAALTEAPAMVGKNIEAYSMRRATTSLMDVARQANKYFNDQEPWKTIKDDPIKCGTTINICLQACQVLTILMEPVMPFTAEKAWRMLGYTNSVRDQSWDDIAKNDMQAGHKLGKIDILFVKMEEKDIRPEIERLQRIQQELRKEKQTEEKEKMEEEKITIDEFAKVKLRVAKVIDAEKVEKSEKLLKLHIDLGDEKRQIVAGVAHHYEPKDIVDKKIIIVVNLEPAKIRGIESQGMLLAAEDDQGRMSLLTPDQEINPGAPVK